MVAHGVHPPEGMVDGQGQPGEGLVEAHVERGEHPLQPWPVQAAVVEVVQEVGVVVPVDEAVMEDRPKGKEGRRSDKERRQAGEILFNARASLH